MKNGDGKERKREMERRDRSIIHLVSLHSALGTNYINRPISAQGQAAVLVLPVTYHRMIKPRFLTPKCTILS
jgi:hypothetical protein